VECQPKNITREFTGNIIRRLRVKRNDAVFETLTLMGLPTTKILSLIAILVIVMVGVILSNSFVARIVSPDASIPPVLDSISVQTETHLVRCDSLVFEMDADGNVYHGKDVVGTLANPVVLTTRAREITEAFVAREEYSRGMDLNLELPLPRCTDEPLYIRADVYAKDKRLAALVRALQARTTQQTRLTVRNKPQEQALSSQRWQVLSIEELDQ